MQLKELVSGQAVSKVWLTMFQDVKHLVSSVIGIDAVNSPNDLQKPPAHVTGDIAFSCFGLAKEVKKPPHQIALEIIKGFKPFGLVTSVTAEGPYCNFTFDHAKVAEQFLKEIASSPSQFGFSEVGDGKRVMVEYSSPNTNKPQHLGHVRNALVGYSCAKMLQAVGFTVIKANLINDRGIHICKSMYAYEHWGNGKTPESERVKPDHFVGSFYVLFDKNLQEEKKGYYVEHGIDTSDMNDQQKKNAETEFLKASVLMKEAQEMLQAWEAGDQEVVVLWKKMNDWVYQGFDQTYKALGVDFEKIYHESEIYQGGKDLIYQAFEQGHLIKRPDGAIIAPLSQIHVKHFTDKIVLRSDGTSVYITQDINLAGMKFREFNLDYSIYCIGGEQDLQMQQVFNTCTIMGLPYGERMYHLSYGMVYLPEGKMKSREGTVVDADDLIKSMHELAAEGLKSRFPDLGSDELAKRAKAIGDAALKYFILQYGRTQAIHFDPKKSIAFEGQTGPYIQYVYARISSILKKVGVAHVELSDLNITNADDEWPVLQELIQFPKVVFEAAIQLEPNVLAAYLFSLCQTFNTYYHSTSIVKTDNAEKPFKLAVLYAVQTTIKNGLQLLGISVLEEM